MSIGDVLAIVTLLFGAFLPEKYIFYTAFYLIIKGALFGIGSRDYVSFLDLVCGIYIILMVYGIKSTFLTVFFCLFLSMKTVMMFAF